MKFYRYFKFLLHSTFNMCNKIELQYSDKVALYHMIDIICGVSNRRIHRD